MNTMFIKKIVKFLVRIALGVAIAIPTLLYPFLYFNQESLLFHPRPLETERASWLHSTYPNSIFSLASEPGILLRGWLKKSSKTGPVLIYFGGNAEEVSSLINVELPPSWSLLLMNYRGYGESTGNPSEVALFHDALAIYDHVKMDFPSIAVMGRSLGTGVAVYVSSQRQVCGTVLVSPYDSVRKLAQAAYPYAPVGWLLKHPFDAESSAPAATAPALGLVAERDWIIPPEYSARLLKAWGGRVREHHFAQADHNSIVSEAKFWPIINQFLTEDTHCLPLISGNG